MMNEFNFNFIYDDEGYDIKEILIESAVLFLINKMNKKEAMN